MKRSLYKILLFTIVFINTISTNLKSQNTSMEFDPILPMGTSFGINGRYLDNRELGAALMRNPNAEYDAIRYMRGMNGYRCLIGLGFTGLLGGLGAMTVSLVTDSRNGDMFFGAGLIAGGVGAVFSIAAIGVRLHAAKHFNKAMKLYNNNLNTKNPCVKLELRTTGTGLGFCMKF
jgi:hypothetical protein